MNYKILNRPLGLGNPYAPNAPCIWPLVAALGGAAIGGAFNLIGASKQNSYTKEQQRLQSQLNREEMNHSMNLQEKYQNMVWSQGAAKEVSGMKNAGLNPATANGTQVGAMPAHPSTGGVGPQGPNMSSLGSDMVSSGLGAAQTVANIQNTEQNTQLQKQQTRTEAANARLKEWEADPRILNLRERGLDSEALKNYAEADVSKATVIEIGNRCQKLAAEVGLTEAETKQVQAATAKTYTEINALVQDIAESKQRVVLMRAQELTERAKQTELYAAADEHRASAAEHRAGVVLKHSEARLKGQEIKNKELEAKAQEISNLMLDYEKQVQAATGDPGEIGALKGARNWVNLVNPLSYINLGLR